jgi:hypothetical protein
MRMSLSRPETAASSETPATVAARGLGRIRAKALWHVVRDRWPEIWPWAPVVFAAVYAIVVLANFSSLITAINMDSDASIAPMIGRLLGGAPHASHVFLGNHPWYESLWFLRATSGLPGYRQLWDIAPATWSVVGIAILAWSAWRALGRWPAALTASALLCAGTAGRFMFFRFDWPGPTALHTVLLGAMVVWLAGLKRPLRAWQLVAIVLVMGAISAAPTAGDQLFLYWAIVPLLFTALLLVWRTRARAHWLILAIAVAVAVIALVGGALLHQAMVRRGWVAAPHSVTFVSSQVLVHNVVLFFQSYTYLAGGTFFGGRPNVPGTAALISALLFIAALVCLPLELRRRAARSAPAPGPLDPGAARRFAYVAFWSTSLACTSAVFVLSNAPVDDNSARYLLAGYIAVGALLGLLALRSRGWRASVTAGVCVFSLIASYQVIKRPFQPQLRFPEPQETNALVRFARAEHVDYGYAGYWDAADLTWISGFKIKVYPVGQCARPTLVICPFYIGISSWYLPRPRTRSMLIVDHKIQLPVVSAPDPALGPPTATATIGALTAYVYPYDIAARFRQR